MTPDSTNYFYATATGRNGPVGYEELRALAVAGTLTRRDKVWCEGMAGWETGDKIDGLFAGLPPDFQADAPPASQLTGVEHSIPQDHEAEGTSTEQPSRAKVARDPDGAGIQSPYLPPVTHSAWDHDTNPVPDAPVSAMDKSPPESSREGQPAVPIRTSKKMMLVIGTAAVCFVVTFGLLGGFSVLSTLQKGDNQLAERNQPKLVAMHKGQMMGLFGVQLGNSINTYPNKDTQIRSRPPGVRGKFALTPPMPSEHFSTYEAGTEGSREEIVYVFAVRHTTKETADAAFGWLDRQLQLEVGRPDEDTTDPQSGSCQRVWIQTIGTGQRVKLILAKMLMEPAVVELTLAADRAR